MNPQKGKAADAEAILELNNDLVRFASQVEASVGIITGEIKKLTEASALEGLSGGRGNDILKALEDLTTSIQNVHSKTMTVKNFVAEKLGDMQALRQAAGAAEATESAAALKKSTQGKLTK